MALFHPSEDLSKFIQVTSHVKYSFCTNLHGRNLQVFLKLRSPEDTFLTGQPPALAMSSCADSIPAKHLHLWWAGKHLLWRRLELLWTAAGSENRMENILCMRFSWCHSSMEEKAVLSDMGRLIWSSAGQGGKREEKQRHGGWEIWCKRMKDLAKWEVYGKTAGVTSVPEEKERLGLTEQGKM